MRGIDRIKEAFESKPGIKLMTHAVCGYPTLEISRGIFAAMAANRADFIEAQLPFSDPSADGPIIVEANSQALKALPQGSRIEICLAMLEDIRKTSSTPILIMSYLNPILAYGIEALTRRMEESALDGLIVPDYPDDEPELRLKEICEARGLALVPLIAPSTSLERAAKIARESASPFLYAVLRMGVTGRKTQLDQDSTERLALLKRETGKYVAAGFGIREREQVRQLEGRADCAIVGSALVKVAQEAFASGNAAAVTDAAARAVRTLSS